MKKPSKQALALADELSGIIADKVLKSTVGFEDRIRNEGEKPFVLAFAMALAVSVLFEGQIEEFIELVRDTSEVLAEEPTWQ